MMNVGKRKKILFGVVAIFLFGACSLLNSASSNNGADPVEPTMIQSPTPNLTLTAVFAKATVDAPEEETQVPTADPSEETSEAPEAQVTEPPPTEIPAVDYRETPAAAVVDKVEALFLSTAPTIDGLLTDWEGEMYSLTEIVYGSEYFANLEDLSGQFKVGWDADNLYLGVVVFDTRFAQTASGTQMYLGDSLEILLDTNLAGDASVTELSADDYQIGISPGNLHDIAIPEAFMWYPSDKIASLPSVQIGAVLINGGYVVEAALPWSEVGVTPTNGKTFGFLLSVSDNDMQNMNAQQSVVSFSPTRELQNPTSWGELLLKNP